MSRWPTRALISTTRSSSATASTTPSGTGTFRSSAPSPRTSTAGNTSRDEIRSRRKKATSRQSGGAFRVPATAGAVYLRISLRRCREDKEAGRGHSDAWHSRRRSAGNDARQEGPAPELRGRSPMDLKRYFRGPFVALLVVVLLFFFVYKYASSGPSCQQ